MVSLGYAAIVLALQQNLQSTPGYTSPSDGDTVGYWQQRVAYDPANNSGRSANVNITVQN